MAKGLYGMALPTTALVGLGIVFFLIPYIPSELLFLTDLFLVRLVLVVGLLFLSCIHPVVMVAAFIVTAYLFIQRNKLKMKQLKMAMQQSTPVSEAIASIVTPPTAPPQPPFTEPIDGSIPFVPTDETGDNTFHPVAPSLNKKTPLPTETVKGSDKAIQQLFSSVNTSLMEQV